MTLTLPPPDPRFKNQMHALTTHITVFLIEFDKFNRMLSSAYKITMNQIIIDFNFSVLKKKLYKVLKAKGR